MVHLYFGYCFVLRALRFLILLFNDGIMNWGKTLLLILVLLAVSGYFYLYEVKGTAEKKLAEEKKKKSNIREKGKN